MKIELKNLKHYPGMSEETTCFQASVYIDGKKAGDVKNDGHGGAHYFYPFDLEEKLNSYGATLPEITQDLGEYGKPGETLTYKQDAESLINDALEHQLVSKELKTLLRSHLVFVRDGNCLQTKVSAETMAASMKNPQLVMEKLKTQTVLNFMPFDKALDIFFAH